jgi:hypothetical protein
MYQFDGRPQTLSYPTDRLALNIDSLNRRHVNTGRAGLCVGTVMAPFSCDAILLLLGVRAGKVTYEDGFAHALKVSSQRINLK